MQRISIIFRNQVNEEFQWIQEATANTKGLLNSNKIALNSGLLLLGWCVVSVVYRQTGDGFRIKNDKTIK